MESIRKSFKNWLLTDLYTTGYIRRLQDLCQHLYEYPEARGVAINHEAIGQTLSILNHSKENMATQLQANEVLAVLGHHGPLKGKGMYCILYKSHY